MKMSKNYLLSGLALAGCCLLIVVNLKTTPSPSPALNVARKDSRHTMAVKPGKRGSTEISSSSRRGTKRPLPTPSKGKNGKDKNSKKRTQEPERRRAQKMQERIPSQRKQDTTNNPVVVMKSADPVPSTRSIQERIPLERKQDTTNSPVPPQRKENSADQNGMSLPTKITVGAIPEWWQESWQRSAVYQQRDQFVGDRPLFPPCDTSSSLSFASFKFEEPPGELLPPEMSKNPCWYLTPAHQKGLRCAPYVYLAGVAKCGTSDISKRLKFHPDVFPGTQKEYHWWERNRFGMHSRDDQGNDKSAKSNGAEHFKDYLQKVTGNDLADLHKELVNSGSSVRIFGDYSPSYLWDPQHWYVLDGNQGCKEPRVVVGHHIRHLWPPAKVILIFRHPTPRLYSRFMSRIPRTPELRKATVQDFHEFVSKGIEQYTACFRQWSIRQCAYNNTLYKHVQVRLVEGMYPAFMQDWLRIWPRDQMLILRFEDYAGHERERMQEIFRFLGLRSPTEEEMRKVLSLDVVNSGTEDYEKHGSMLPETKQLLDTFYQPFVHQFAAILKDQRFLWKDVYQ